MYPRANLGHLFEASLKGIKPMTFSSAVASAKED